jgi:methionine-rich copper-binding protein CopC
MKIRLGLALSILAAACAAPQPAPPPAPAASSSILASSSPADGAVVAAPRQLRLVFREPVRLAEVVVAGPDGEMPMMLSPAGAQTTYVLPLDGLSPGVHDVRWRAVTGGGTTRQGTLRFTVR